MRTQLETVIKAMEFSAATIVADMRRQFPIIRVRCLECGKTRFGSWNYLKTGWPKCHGQTMRLEAK